MNKNKNKVWLITRRAGYNFGSSLQAFAMQYTVEKLGYPNLIIDYDELHHNLRWKIRPFILDCVYAISCIIPFLFKAINPRFFFILKNRNEQQAKFSQFDQKTLKVTPKRYKTFQAIAKDSIDCDVCICGSDQIWSPLLFDPVMYLNFASKRTRKIAYAPSIGTMKIDKHRNEIKKLVENFDFLSIREQQGATLLKELTGKYVEVTLDPTLLLNANEWKSLQKELSIDYPYILCYFLGQELIPHAFIEKLREQTKMEIINISMFYNQNVIKQAKNMNNISPEEFLWLVAHASSVCTDSFHGTIFSIIMHQNFFTFERFKNTSENNQNSRIYNLLTTLNLQNRLVKCNDEPNDHRIEIDYVKVDKTLCYLKEKSISYLQMALNQ